MDNKHAPSFLFQSIVPICLCACVCVAKANPSHHHHHPFFTSLESAEHESPIRQSVKRHHDLA